MGWRDLLPARVRDVLRNLRYGGSVGAKRARELSYWTSRARHEERLRNEHYEEYFTEPFDLDPAWFSGKRLLDVGCGPRGSLVWAERASLRIGVDPLVDAYRRFGIRNHGMYYVAGRAEELPFPDGSFDVVSSLNSLDHVEDVDVSAKEMARVTAQGGAILLVVEVRHAPTVEEPHDLPWDVVERFGDAFEPLVIRYKEAKERQFTTSAARGRDVDPAVHTGPALVVAHLRKVPGQP